MLFKYRYAILGGGAILLALAPGCGQPKVRDELVVAHRGLPLTLKPFVKAEVVTLSAQANIYEPLVDFDPQMRLRPVLAERWENPDERTWIFFLRQGVRFHDGRPLEAEDVAYSLDWARNNTASEQSPALAMIEEVRTDGQRTVRIVTHRPYPILLNKIREIFIVPRGSQEDSTAGGRGWKPVGTGAYSFLSFPAGGPLRLARWDGYWAGRAEFSGMEFMSFQSPQKAQALMASGQADIVADISPDLADRLAAGMTGYSAVRWPGLTVRYLGLDTRTGSFRDVRVRRALSMAIDREALVRDVCRGYATPANQMASQMAFGFNTDLPSLGRDTARARQLLKEAGYPGGLELELLLPESRANLGQELQRQLAEAGIRLRLRAVPRESFFSQLDTAGFYFLGGVSPSGDVSDILDDLLHSQQGRYGRTNLGRYRNRKLDRLIELASEEMVLARRQRLLQQALAEAAGDLPCIPLYVDHMICGVSSRVSWQPLVDLRIQGHQVAPAEGRRDIK